MTKPELPTEAMVELRNHQQRLDADGKLFGITRQAIDEVLAYLEATSPAISDEVVDWKPIETAPRDGTRVLSNFGKQVTIIRYENGVWSDDEGWTSNSGYVTPPTHWMPLPAPPSGSDQPPTDARPNSGGA